MGPADMRTLQCTPRQRPVRVEQMTAHLKLPSTPETSIALIIILVSLNGTCTQNNIETQPNTRSRPLQQLWAYAASLDARRMVQVQALDVTRKIV